MNGVKDSAKGNKPCGIDFSHLPSKYWSNTTKMSYLQRRIIVYSIMYYETDESCVSDQYYDSISHQLAQLMQESTEEECEATTYWYAMHDFDGSTGFDTPSRLTREDREYLGMISTYVHSKWRKETKGKTKL